MQIIPNLKDVQRLLAGLQNQYTGYSYNLSGGRITQLAMEFISPVHLNDSAVLLDSVPFKEKYNIF